MLRKRKRATTESRKKREKRVNTLPLYIILIMMFVLYLFTQGTPALSVIFGIVAFVLIIILLAAEIFNGIEESGFMRNVLEIVVAIIIVIGIWFLLRIILNTAYPLDVVPSCSMLPALHRGDMILVQGVGPSGINAPIVNITPEEWNASFSSVGTEALQCVAYEISGNQLYVSQLVKPGYQVGLIENNGAGTRIVPYSAQTGAVKYMCGIANATYQNGTVVQSAYTQSITIDNTTINGDRNNSVVVYQTVPQDLFYRYGDSYIVHRAYAIINVSGTYHVLTKGDNNPGLDIQYLNLPPNVSQVSGRVIGSVAYLGYIKLILSSSFTEPAGCNLTIND